MADFDGGAITSEAGGLLLRAADQAIGLVERLAACFQDRRRPELIEHALTTLVGQRVFGLALGYESVPLGRRSRTSSRRRTGPSRSGV